VKVNLKQIEAFVWVADLGSFVRAGERLATSQPNISARISNLESALGVALFERDGVIVKLTEPGQHLLIEAREILRAADRFVATAGLSHHSEGIVRLGVTELIVNTWLPDFLSEAKVRFPNQTIELTVDMSMHLSSSLYLRSIDLAFQNAPFSHDASGSEALGSYAYVWVGAPELVKTLPVNPTAEKLQQLPILVQARETRQYAEVVEHFSLIGGATGLNLVPSSSIAPLMQMAIAGIGIGALPAAMVRGSVASGKLELIDYSWFPEPLMFSARYDGERSPLAIVELAALGVEVAENNPRYL